jgi:hypothetical protein
MFHTAQSIGGYRGGPSGAYGDAQTGPTRSPLSPSGGSPGDRVRRRSDGLLAALEGLSMQDAGCDFPRTRLLVLQRHFALLGSAASVLGTLQRGLIIFATY